MKLRFFLVFPDKYDAEDIKLYPRMLFELSE